MLPADPAAEATTEPSPAPPRGHPPVGHRQWWRPAALVAAVVLLLAVLAGVELTRPVPAAVLHLSLPASLLLPGRVTGLPWPAQGQARLDVEGLGTIGQSGDGRPVPIGSVAKVMTAYVVLTDHPLHADDPGPAITITPADVANYKARMASDQSLVPVTAGEQLTERQALEALLLPSANNVAQILATWDAGSIPAFLAKMNATAAHLGLTASHYTDPSGYLPTTVSTAADQTLLAEHALTIAAFAKIVALPTATLPVVGPVFNYNGLLGTDGVFGVKTGSTGEAGGNLVFAAHLTIAHQTITFVGAVLGQPGTQTPEQLAAVDDATRQLLTAAKSTVRAYTVLPAGVVGTIRGPSGSSAPVSSPAPLQTVAWPGRRVTITQRPARIGASVHAGQEVGTLTVDAGVGATTVPLRADTSVSAPSWWQRLTRLP